MTQKQLHLQKAHPNKGDSSQALKHDTGSQLHTSEKLKAHSWPGQSPSPSHCLLLL